jgi:hypothetical protein
VAFRVQEQTSCLYVRRPQWSDWKALRNHHGTHEQEMAGSAIDLLGTPRGGCLEEVHTGDLRLIERAIL